MTKARGTAPAATPAPTPTPEPTPAPSAAPSADPTPGPTPAPVPAPELTKARVLSTGAFGVINQVVEVDANTLKQGVAAGQLDPHPDAVAYAASLS